MKTLTRKQIESRKARSAQLARDVRHDDDLADRIENESLGEYADRRHMKIANPKRGQDELGTATRRELLDLIKELQADNENLQYRLEEIGDLVGTSEEGEQD